MSIESAGICVIGSLLVAWVMLEIAVAVKQRRRRNRWLDEPAKDDRDSIQAFRKIMGKGS